jgi:ABC-type taurine transport system substrate-binding protein
MITMDISSAKDIDGAYAWEPWISKMEALGGKVVTRTVDLGLNTSDHWVVREKWAKANAVTAQRRDHYLLVSSCRLALSPR